MQRIDKIAVAVVAVGLGASVHGRSSKSARGTRATDAEIIKRMVDVKCRIDRIKEQVQNVE